MPRQRAAAHEACCAGVAPTARAASMMTRMVEAKPTTTAVVAAEMRPNQPLASVRHGIGIPGSYLDTRMIRVVLHVFDICSGGEVSNDEVLQGCKVRANKLQKEIRLARNGIGLAHQRPAGDPRLEGLEFGIRLALEPHHGEELHPIAQQRTIQHRAVPGDGTGLFQRLEAPEAGRRRKSDALRQLHIGDPPVTLQLAQDPPVGGIELEWETHGRAIASPPARRDPGVEPVRKRSVHKGL